MTEPTLIFSDLRFPEGARWHDDQLWFSDMHTGQIFRANPASRVLEEVATFLAAGRSERLGDTTDVRDDVAHVEQRTRCRLAELTVVDAREQLLELRHSGTEIDLAHASSSNS